MSKFKRREGNNGRKMNQQARRQRQVFVLNLNLSKGKRGSIVGEKESIKKCHFLQVRVLEKR
jgi:hypothetical protein